jgi:hypothetical protein
MTIHDTVRTERQQRGWSVRYAAQRGGISNTCWHSIETGIVRLTPRKAAAVAAAYGWADDWDQQPPPRLAAVLDELAELRTELADIHHLITIILDNQTQRSTP